MSLTEVNKLRAWQLFLFAAAVLYFELAIIRFASSEVLYLGYFNNFVLLSAFVGLGLGFLSAKTLSSEAGALRGFGISLVFIFALILVARFDVNFLKNHDGLHFFGNVLGTSGLPGWLLLVILFFSIVSLFFVLGREVGRLFGYFKPLQAYALDVGGSLGGILLFTVQSLSGSSPVIWLMTGSLILLLAVLIAPDSSVRTQGIVQIAIGLLSLVLLKALPIQAIETVWSPYQKLTVFKKSNEVAETVEIYANGVLHQIMIPADIASELWYGLPYKIHRDAGGAVNDVLIIGAGSGTDVAVALRQNSVLSVDAVDIDPVIMELGNRYYKDSPYRDSRVRQYVQDGRAFIKQTSKKYDLIIFALPDSLMRLSSHANVRLESFLFTLESFKEVQNLLKPGGSFFLYNQYRWDWLKNKISHMVESVFNKPPLRVEFMKTTLLGIGDRLQSTPYEKVGYKQLATDDWPHIYMQAPQLSWFYMAMIASMFLLALLGVRILAPPGSLLKPDFVFFFMGVAFLLLEARSITVFSLLFGATWLVNSLVFAGILTSVLVANFIVSRFKISNRKVLFAGLFLCLAFGYLLEPSFFLQIDQLALRYTLAIAFYFSPIFFANLVFSREFRDDLSAQSAFGWNLLGAVVGGGLEYAGLVIGSQNLLLVAIGAYLLAFWTLTFKNRN